MEFFVTILSANRTYCQKATLNEAMRALKEAHSKKIRCLVTQTIDGIPTKSIRYCPSYTGPRWEADVENAP